MLTDWWRVTCDVLDYPSRGGGDEVVNRNRTVQYSTVVMYVRTAQSSTHNDC